MEKDRHTALQNCPQEFSVPPHGAGHLLTKTEMKHLSLNDRSSISAESKRNPVIISAGRRSQRWWSVSVLVMASLSFQRAGRSTIWCSVWLSKTLWYVCVWVGFVLTSRCVDMGEDITLSDPSGSDMSGKLKWGLGVDQKKGIIPTLNSDWMSCVWSRRQCRLMHTCDIWPREELNVTDWPLGSI